MTPRYLSTVLNKRGRPKTTSTIQLPNQTRQATEYIDKLYRQGEIALEHRLAAIYYRALYYQVHTPIGTPNLASAKIASLSLRFKVYRSFFTPEEREEWYQDKERAWKELRKSLVQDKRIFLNLIDDLIIYKATDELYFKYGLTSQQLDMLERALTHMVGFFGIG
jgi:hypothetical protein